ncbi:aminopeptidase N [uncultured Propionibacterium sp.]|uniref:aminopeptidase N n=1 Tax=uncultured Propionibacterium sp. TaxID=218066 RepID=UPI00292DC638|nr:aminopeptidase N [uncultured Propionibacterium sp.]
MNPANLTREEAAGRSAALSITSYEVTVDLTGHGAASAQLTEPEETFLSTSTVKFTSTATSTWIDLIADEIAVATLDGEPLDPVRFADSRLPLSLGDGEHELTITAICRYSHTGEGLHRFVDPADGDVYLYTQFETADARRMYACFEQPDLKATFQLTVRAPAGWVVKSNSPTPEPFGPDPIGAEIWDFAPTPRISTYVTALIAGQYHVDHGTVESAKGTLDADLVCRASMRPYLDAERIRTTTQRGFEIYEKDFGRPYAFDKYDQLFVPEYNAGAMENAGAVTIRDEYLYRSKVTSAAYEARDNTILHELAHMWFGDLVTMRWWDDLWLNESFAEWSAYHCQERIADAHGGIDPWVSFANARKAWAYTADQLPTTHPIAADMVDLEAVEQNFDGITYAKGASVLKQLVAYVGQDDFLTGVRQYLNDHAFANAQFSDLLDALGEISGKDLAEFSTQWLSTSGVNTLSNEIVTDEDGVITAFSVLQSAPADHGTLRTHHIAIGLYDAGADELVAGDSLEVDVHGPSTPIAALEGRRRPALILLNDRDLSYAKVRLDEDSLATAIGRVGQITDPLARALVWNSAWDMTRDAQMTAADYIAMVIEGAGKESDMTAVTTQLTRALTAATAYTAPAQREANNGALVAGVAAQLKETVPGSEHQLAFADALMAAVNNAQGAGLIAGWLNGEELPLGLAIDQDRRWAILTSLARLGVIDEERIEVETAIDQTISGAERAAGARSAMADADAKARAWELATATRGVPNATHLHICRQFMQYGQDELLAGYVEKYLQAAEEISARAGIWADQGHAASSAVLTWLWPAPLVTRELIAGLDEWADSADLTEAVRRTISERRDAALRALAAQEYGARAAGA